MTHLPDNTPPVDVAVAAYSALAKGRTRIVLTSLEDAVADYVRTYLVSGTVLGAESDGSPSPFPTFSATR